MEETDTIDLRKYLATARKKWWLFAISIVFFLALAVFYHCYHMEQVLTYSELLVEEDETTSGSTGKSLGGMAAIMRTFSIGGMGSSSVDNELMIMQSHNLLVNTIRNLNLNFTYVERPGFKKINVYKKSPVILDCPRQVLDTLSRSIKFKISLHDGKADITAKEGWFKTIAEKKGASLPCCITTPYGNVQVLKSQNYKAADKRTITVMMAGNDIAYTAIYDDIKVDYSSKKADGIFITYKATNRQMGKDLLNGMMNEYNRMRLERKNDKAQQSIEFYDKMIAEINSSLNKSEQKMQDFQSKNNFVSPEDELGYYFKADKMSEQEIAVLRDKMAFYNLVLAIVNDPAKQYEMLPAVLPAGEKKNTNIEEYNKLILNKRNLERSATADNAALRLVISQIDAMRDVVKENILLLKQGIANEIKSAQGLNSQNKSQLSKAPSNQREYINLYRDKELQNDLYVFLLERRYNSAMTLASNHPRGFIIDPAFCALKPILTKSIIAAAACLFIGLLLPTVLVIIITNRKRTEPAVEVEDETEE